MANIYDMTDTWNSSGTTFTSIKMNVTNTASAAQSKLMDLQVDGNTKVDIDKDGNLSAAGVQVTGTIQDGTGDVRKVSVATSTDAVVTIPSGSSGKLFRLVGGGTTTKVVVDRTNFLQGDVVTIYNVSTSTLTLEFTNWSNGVRVAGGDATNYNGSTVELEGYGLVTLTAVAGTRLAVSGNVSQLIDDYEEGTWSGSVTDTSGNTSATTFSGTYTKIGRVVVINWSAANIDTTGMTSGNPVRLLGLPFTPTANHFSAANLNDVDIHDGTYIRPPVFRIFDNAGTPTIQCNMNRDNNSSTALRWNELTSGSADLNGTMTYQTDD
jgi:hypothetical protein